MYMFKLAQQSTECLHTTLGDEELISCYAPRPPHHRGPFCEGQGLTHALTDTAPTDLTVATHSPLGAQPQSDRILRLPCGRLAPAAPCTVALDALKHACRSSSLQVEQPHGAHGRNR